MSQGAEFTRSDRIEMGGQLRAKSGCFDGHGNLRHRYLRWTRG